LVISRFFLTFFAPSMLIVPQAESKLSDSCAARVFSLLNKMPALQHINCHRCAVSTAGACFDEVLDYQSPVSQYSFFFQALPLWLATWLLDLLKSTSLTW
jgi:hypothetical protein